MITQVVLENFQSHKLSTFNFDKGLNVIVGSSNQGKSSLVRALSLVLYNQWDSSWVRATSSFCRVTLTLDSGAVIVREKGSKVNKYIVKIPNQPDQEFNNFGLQVPEAVQKVLNIRTIELDKDDSISLNLSSQLENLFMFNRSGSQKAKVFGHLSGAHYLDFALRSLATEQKQVGTEKNLKTQELGSLKNQLTALEAVNSYKSKLGELETKNAALDIAGKRLESLKSLFLRTQEWKKRYGTESSKESLLSQVKSVETASVEASVQRLKQLKQLLNWKNELILTENALNSTKNQLNLQFDTETAEYVRILRENSVCPTCFERLDEQKLSKIQDNLIGNEKCCI